MEELQQNKILSRLKSDPALLAINGIFNTIQGEGIYAGTPVTFIRFNICHVGCSFCDTKYTWEKIDVNLFAQPLNVVQRLTKIRASRHLVLSGGEPFEQPNLLLLLNVLVKLNYFIQIETSGKIRLKDDMIEFLNQNTNNVFVTLSPKSEHSSFKKISLGELKLLVDQNSMFKDVINYYKKFKEVKNLSLQPIDYPEDKVRSELNLDIAIHLATKFMSLNLIGVSAKVSVQIHKYLRIA